MATGKAGSRIFANVKREIKKGQTEAIAALRHIEVAAKKSGNKELVKRCVQERKRITLHFDHLQVSAAKLLAELKEEVSNSATNYKKVIQELEQLKESMASDNILLEFKKKDLLQKANELENAYDEIAARNKELEKQKQIIVEQAGKLQTAHEEILEKNNLLEARTESLQDQADYLHEANEAITAMHKELQAQKDEIESKNRELLNLNTEKNNLIGIVAHDLKSPLNQIKGLVSIIKITAPNLEGEPANCLAMIEGSANRLSDMIAKILDIEAIESRQLNLVIEPVNLSEVLRTVCDRYAVDVQRKNISLLSNITSDVMIRADKSYLDQVIDNLLSNAVKFSPANKNIFIDLSLQHQEAICAVRDEGPGLTDDDKRKLFSKYQKLSAKPTGEETSTGLGLSIVKKFVEAMDGKIWCESEVGKGAGFFLRFATHNGL
jgi:signal transduction histidine kinase